MDKPDRVTKEKSPKSKKPRRPHRREAAERGGSRWTHEEETDLWNSRIDDNDNATHDIIGKRFEKSGQACRLKYFKLKALFKAGKWSPIQQESDASSSSAAASAMPLPPRPLQPATSATAQFRGADGMRPPSPQVQIQSGPSEQHAGFGGHPSTQQGEFQDGMEQRDCQVPLRTTTNLEDEDQITGAANLLSLSQRSHRYPVAAYRIAQSIERATAQSTEHRQAEAPAQSHYFGFTIPVSVTAPAIANPERVPGSSDGNPWFYRRVPNHAQYAENSYQTALHPQYPSRVLPPPTGYVLEQTQQYYLSRSAPQHAQRIHEHQANFNTYYVDESQ